MTPDSIEAFGEHKSAYQWAKDARARVSKAAILKRIRDGWQSEAAIATPAAKKKATIKSRNGVKRPKPPAGSPLKAHASGRWCGRVAGRDVYFERWDQAGDSHSVSLAEFRQMQANEAAGFDPHSVAADSRVTLAELCNEFLASKQRVVDSGELRAITLREYEQTTDRIVHHFGGQTVVEDITPLQLDAFRAELAEGVAVGTLAKRIRTVRVVFKFAYDAGLIDRPMRFGNFKEPSRKVKRVDRNRTERQHGSRMFEAAEIRLMIERADPVLRAFVLLGINAGLGASDIAWIPRTGVLDLDAGWLDYPRNKTGEQREAPIWPETVEAVRVAIKRRGKPRSEADRDLMFLTKYGQAYVRDTDKWKEDAIAQNFTKLVKRCGCHRHGAGFYSLRRTFQTMAEEQCGDAPAIRRIMGHVDASSDMSSVYRQRISRERLQAVTDAVRRWLFASSIAESVE